MPRMNAIRPRLVLALASLTAALAIAGCGGGGSSSTDPASIAPPGVPVYVDAAVRPQGEVKKNVESLAESVAGIDDPGAFIVSKIDSSLADSDKGVTYAHDIEPWLGEQAAIFFEHYDGNDFTGTGAIVQSTDTDATQGLIDKLAKSNDVRDASYDGVDYEVKSSDGSVLGIVDDFLVYAEDEGTFKDVVDASKGDALAGADTYSQAISAQPSGSLADAFVDIGGLIKQAGGSIDPQAAQAFKAIGVDPSDATALASVVPGSDQLEIDLSTNAGGTQVPTGAATDLLESFPADSVAAFASSGFGASLKQAIDQIDASGLPPKVPPHQLKSALAATGIDLDKIVGSIQDAGAFATGTSRSDIGGAAVLTTDDANTAKEAVANVGLLLRRTGAPGITAVGGGASGFSVHSPQLGRQPLVVAAKGERIAIGYGLAATLSGLATSSSNTLGDSSTYKAAADALGGAPLSGFVDGAAALRLAEGLGAAGDEKFQAAKPYLSKVRFLAFGAVDQGDLATTKVIVGFDK
jgi:hypothetical protein